jgi:hypothetical protein
MMIIEILLYVAAISSATYHVASGIDTNDAGRAVFWGIAGLATIVWIVANNDDGDDYEPENEYETPPPAPTAPAPAEGVPYRFVGRE